MMEVILNSHFTNLFLRLLTFSVHDLWISVSFRSLQHDVVYIKNTYFVAINIIHFKLQERHTDSMLGLGSVSHSAVLPDVVL